MTNKNEAKPVKPFRKAGNKYHDYIDWCSLWLLNCMTWLRLEKIEAWKVSFTHQDIKMLRKKMQTCGNNVQIANHCRSHHNVCGQKRSLFHAVPAGWDWHPKGGPGRRRRAGWRGPRAATPSPAVCRSRRSDWGNAQPLLQGAPLCIPNPPSSGEFYFFHKKQNIWW